MRAEFVVKFARLLYSCNKPALTFLSEMGTRTMMAVVLMRMVMTMARVRACVFFFGGGLMYI